MTVEPNSPNTRPFTSAPDPQRYFPAPAIEDARQRLLRAIARQEGPALICGIPGVGKSLLLLLMAEHFEEQLSVVQLSASQLCSRRELLQAVLFQLDLPYRGLDDGELRLSVLSHLRAPSSQGVAPTRLLLLVDEAESLSIELLEELRGLSNLSDRGVSLTSLVLAGGAAVEERFADARLDGFSQRVATRCYLGPLSRQETFQYVRSQIAATGEDPDQLLTPSALEAIFAATDGVVRLINQIGDQLFWILRQGGASCLDAAAVQQVWSELQQLPAPWDTQAPAKTRPVETEDANVVEFGPLADAAPESAPHGTDGIAADATWEVGDVEASPANAPDVESFAADDDEMPSSIPFGAHLAEDDEEIVEAYDLAGRGGFVDPFGEAFDEEEALDDRYAQFESQMLRAAPLVRNQLDAAFAGDLSRAGLVAGVGLAAVPASDDPLETVFDTTLETVVVADAAMDPPAVAAVDEASDTMAEMNAAAKNAAPQEAATVEPVADPTPPSYQLPVAPSPADEALLVVEDDGRPTAAVVPSAQFRRLFSQLETAAG